MKTHLIGLTGLAGAGKDTVADILVKHAGFEKMAFADALRGEVASGFDVPLELLTDRATKEVPTPRLALGRGLGVFVDALYRASVESGAVMAGRNAYDAWCTEPRSPRQIMQWWGTEYRRAQDPHYWTRALLARMLFRAKDGQTRIVVTDVRFPNEAALIRTQQNGVLWQIHGHASAMRGAIMTTAEERKHESEVDGSGFSPDRLLGNIGTLTQLEVTVRNAFIDLEWPAL